MPPTVLTYLAMISSAVCAGRRVASSARAARPGKTFRIGESPRSEVTRTASRPEAHTGCSILQVARTIHQRGFHAVRGVPKLMASHRTGPSSNGRTPDFGLGPACAGPLSFWLLGSGRGALGGGGG